MLKHHLCLNGFRRNMKYFAVISALLSVTLAAPGHPGSLYHNAADFAPAHYQYGYQVHDDYHGTNFGASEARDGYNTNGEYHVQLPDGRLQTVNYYVDDVSGYVADVKYDGVPHYGGLAHHGGIGRHHHGGVVAPHGHAHRGLAHHGGFAFGGHY